MNAPPVSMEVILSQAGMTVTQKELKKKKIYDLHIPDWIHACMW